LIPGAESPERAEVRAMKSVMGGFVGLVVLSALAAVPVEAGLWGRMKAIYR